MKIESVTWTVSLDFFLSLSLSRQIFLWHIFPLNFFVTSLGTFLYHTNTGWHRKLELPETESASQQGRKGTYHPSNHWIVKRLTSRKELGCSGSNAQSNQGGANHNSTRERKDTHTHTHKNQLDTFVPVRVSSRPFHADSDSSRIPAYISTGSTLKTQCFVTFLPLLSYLEAATKLLWTVQHHGNITYWCSSSDAQSGPLAKHRDMWPDCLSSCTCWDSSLRVGTIGSVVQPLRISPQATRDYWKSINVSTVLPILPHKVSQSCKAQ